MARGLGTEAPAAVFLGVVAWAVLINLQRGTLGQWAAAKFLNAGAVTPLPTGARGTGTPAKPAIPGVFINPVPGSTVLSRWGAPRDGGARSHQGIDLGASSGTPVLAAQAGTIARSGDGGALCGTRVAIRHTDSVETLYCHLNATAVAAGAEVRQGETIGYVGNTGNASTTGPHLHFEIRIRGVPTDPAPFLGV